MSPGDPSARPSRTPSAGRTALQSIALAILGSLAFGFGVGLWLRCRMEAQKPPLLGATPPPGTPAATRARAGG